MITKEQVIEQFGFDPETVGLRHCGWWIVEAVEGEEEIANAEVGHLCVSTLDGGDNPIDVNAFKVGDFVGTATDRFGCTYRYYYYRPLAAREASK